MKKKELRLKYKQLRSEIPKNLREEKSSQIAYHLSQLPVFEFTTYHIFSSIEKTHEVNTQYILDILSAKGKRVALPRMDSNSKLLKHILLTNQTIFKTNLWGISEPQNGMEIAVSEIDVVFIPLLAYDLKGNRVGYGGGFYDIFLADCRKNTLKIGLSFFQPEKTEIEDIFETDIPLDLCITPCGIFDFRS